MVEDRQQIEVQIVRAVSAKRALWPKVLVERVRHEVRDLDWERVVRLADHGVLGESIEPTPVLLQQSVPHASHQPPQPVLAGLVGEEQAVHRWTEAQHSPFAVANEMRPSVVM